MKKYVKPELFFERYELAQHIAACAWDMTLSSAETCAATPDPEIFKDWGGFTATLFMERSMCDMIAGEEYQDYCYQNGADGISTHAS